MIQDSEELTLRSMDRKEALDLLERIKARALEAAEKGAEKIRERERERVEREAKRRAELKQQAAELQAAEDGGKTQ